MSAASPATSAALRLRAAHLLGSASLDPPGMPTSGMLLVRRLADPLPLGLTSDRAPAAVAREWERAAQNALARCWREAARPAFDVVPPSANAVRFDDPAELLAALAHALATGQDASQWWWRALLRGTNAPTFEQLVALWQRDAQYIPAALRRLADRRQLQTVLRMFSPRQSWQLFTAVADVYGLSALCVSAQVAHSAREPHDPAPRTVMADASKLIGLADALSEPSIAAPPPWVTLLGPSVIDPSLPDESVALAGVSLVLHHSPLAARTRAFHLAFLEWRVARRDALTSLQGAVSPLMLQRRPDSTSAATTPRTPAPERAIPTRHRPSPEQRDDGPGSEGSSGQEPMPGTSRRPDVKRTHSPPDAVTLAPPVDLTRDWEPAEGTSPASRADDVRTAAALGAEAQSPTATPLPERGLRIVDDAHRVPTEAIDIQAPSSHAPSIFEPPSVSDAAIEVAETALGGVMFLINAFTALGLFELLYEQPDLGAMVGSWAWLEHIARALIGRDHPEFDGDSIWRVLATLDGRAPDDRLSANSVEQLRALTATTLETLRARLLAVMTLPSDAAEQLVPALLACPALIASGPTHVDVRMALSDARGAVRLAGLDATPGWVAPLGRVITFYFA